MGAMKRSLVLMSVAIVVWGMWDRWWHLAGFVVCCICYAMSEAVLESELTAAVKEAKQLDKDLVRHMAAVDQVHAEIRGTVVVMCSKCKDLFDSPAECETHACGS